MGLLIVCQWYLIVFIKYNGLINGDTCDIIDDRLIKNKKMGGL